VEVTDDLSVEERDEMAMKAITRKMGDDLNQMIERHEEIMHKGGSCIEERVNSVAYLAHRVGIRDRHSLWMLIKRIEDYEDYHHEHEAQDS
jgi:hypothetical protein